MLRLHTICARRGRAVSQPTIHDVAKAAGVSVTTVSHALNGKGRVDPQTRARVARVVRRLGYRANRHARGLRSGRSGSLGLLLPVSGDARSDETLRLDFYMRLAGDGAIVADPSPDDKRVKALKALGLPVVTIGRGLGRPDYPRYVAAETDA